ncbi:MAG TPA: M56 family metallopeptidase, partial [Longimicrobiales bacterium]
ALWWQTARLRQAMELDCDARVLRRHPDPQSYAGVLLDVARGESRWMLASPAMARRRSLERRIRLLVPRRRPLRSAALGIVTASGLVLLACGVERPRPDLAAPMTLAAPATSVVSQSSSPAPAETPAVSYVEAADVTPPVVVDVEVAEPRLPVPTPMDAVSDTPPPAVRPNVEDVPSFTPMTQRPTLRNIDEMRAALRRFYPPVLRDAGVGGTATVWFLIDETGRVQRTQIQRSSGNATLDEAALQVARMMEFTPARNRDREVAVWIQLPIVFDARHGEGPAGLGAVDPAAMVDSIFTTELFQAAATRPAGYPARLPFVPGTAATVTDFRDGVRAGIFWHDPSPDVVERATALSRADGWVLVSDSTQYMNPEFGIRVVRLQRNGIEREIVAGLGDAPMAMLVQARPEE